MPFDFVFPLPPTVNHSYGSRYVPKLHRSFIYKTKEAKDWEKEAAEIIESKFKAFPEADVLGVTVNWYLKRDRDVDGNAKLILDIMQGRVYKNDKQVVEFHSYKKMDKENPRVEVIVHPTTYWSN